MPNEIPAVFHNGSNCNCHFIIKELANKFKDQFECWGENAESSVPMAKEVTKIDKDGNESVATVTCKIKFIDSARFMVSWL